MIAETKPDTVIVTTIDSTHHIYIAWAMALSCDVITEKPMTTDLPKLQAIFEAIEQTGRSLWVTFNYRYAPAYTRFRQLVMDGAVGQPLAVDFSWMLDTSHRADYFRRWHREKQNREMGRCRPKGPFKQARMRVFPMFGEVYDVDVPVGEGGHGGADPVMLEQIFSPTPPPDPYHRAASHIDGAASVLVGIAANQAMSTGQVVHIDDLFSLSSIMDQCH